MKRTASEAERLLHLARGRRIRLDSRAVESGDVFIALKGKRTDGHSFIGQARANGAEVVVASEERSGVSLVVEDPVTVLFEAARLVIETLKDIKKIVITGSNGKTTAKEITAFLLSQLGKTFKTPGNMNTDIGVPASIVERAEELIAADFAVFEVATDGPGDIAKLTRLIEPFAAVLLNVGTAHVGNFESGQALFEEKLSVFFSHAGISIAIANNDDNRILERLKDFPGRKYFFGMAGGDFRIRDYDYRKDKTLLAFDTPEGTKMMRLNGTWHIGHILDLGAAYLTAQAMGLDEPSLYLPSYVLRNDGRFAVRSLNGITVVDDTYNSSPESIRAAVESINRFHKTGRRFAVVGSILEQGDNAIASHQKAGEYLRDFEGVILYTKDDQVLSMEEALQVSFRSSVPEEIAFWLSRNARANDLIYFKASRAVEMETVLRTFLEMISDDS
ncbi:MAG: UDP-N-acetylmuramoyl-tripeptide--D-alanyl-D-alanine ligase [Thermotogales bacterium 46_20]|nr:MAG: UDP-N-acetylmuramoyl-tripeptide--D-alanyl-D-alanine ligase [Thermotogales bacterium 46_20]